MKLESETIFLRLVNPEDAGFIISLRTDAKFNKYLSYVDADVSKQEQWIIDYKEREKAGKEFYYIIHRNSDSLAIGTVRVYDFIIDQNSFCWGSWILNENKTKYAALECALMIYDMAFLEMGFRRCHMDIRKENTKVVEFHKRFGVKIVDENEIDYIGHYFFEDYMNIRDSIIRIIRPNE